MGRFIGLIILTTLLFPALVAQQTDPYHKSEGGFGSLLESSGAASLWWCEGAYKVMKDTPLPRMRSRSIELMAAGNEYEAFQLIIYPTDTLCNLSVSLANLKGPYGEISKDNFEIRILEYVYVSKPTDTYAYSGYWPDPLPPLTDSLSILPGENTVLWLCIYVPASSQPGIYNTTVSLGSDSWSADIPLKLKVRSFTLPYIPSIRSGFGLSVDKIAAYHNITDRDMLEETFDLYMQAFRDYRIAPYSFYYLFPIERSTEGISWIGGYYDSQDTYSGKYSLRMEDSSVSSDPGCDYIDLIELDSSREYTLSWQCRSGTGIQQYTVVAQGYNSSDSLLVFESRAEAFSCDTVWKKESLRLRNYGKDVAKMRLSLYPVFRTATGENTGTVFFDEINMQQAGDKAILLPGGDFEIDVDSINITLDFTNFDRAAERYLDDFGFNGFRLNLDGMGSGSYYSREEGIFEGFSAGTEEYEKLMSLYLSQIESHLSEKGWLGREYIYWFDEPGTKDYPFVREGMELIKKAAPRLTTFLTENEPGPEIMDVTDISCTILNRVDKDRVSSIRDGGGEYWSYICTGPKAPWISEFIDHDAINLRMWLWMSYSYRLNGILIWSTNYWTSRSATEPGYLQNPWTEAASYVQGYGWPLGKQTNWGNGDGRFFYPPNRKPGTDNTTYLEGPVPSLRLEFLRQGIEDYEYFVMLEKLLEENGSELPQGMLRKASRLLAIPDEIFMDGRNYTKNPALLYKHRQKLAEQIEEILHIIK